MIAKIYAELIFKGKKSLEDVPLLLRKDVEQIINKRRDEG